jgi:hypothetical protein
VAKTAAEKAKAVWVPFQTMFDEAISEDTPANYWAGDGVHPTMAGHALMARTWLDATGLGLSSPRQRSCYFWRGAPRLLKTHWLHPARGRGVSPTLYVIGDSTAAAYPQ